jgi:hypothetical protein
MKYASARHDRRGQADPETTTRRSFTVPEPTQEAFAGGANPNATEEERDFAQFLDRIASEDGRVRLEVHRKGRRTAYVDPNDAARLQMLNSADSVLGMLLQAFADAESAHATGFDRVLAGDLRGVPVTERLGRLRYDLREVAASVSRGGAAAGSGEPA